MQPRAENSNSDEIKKLKTKFCYPKKCKIYFINFASISTQNHKGVHQFPGGVRSRKLYSNSVFLWRFQKKITKKFTDKFWIQIFNFWNPTFKPQQATEDRLRVLKTFE